MTMLNHIALAISAYDDRLSVSVLHNVDHTDSSILVVEDDTTFVVTVTKLHVTL